MNSIYAIVLIAALLGLINIGSSTVLNDVVSLVLEGFYFSYLSALSLLLYRRLRGDISKSSDDLEVSAVNGPMHGQGFTWGPWRIKGALGVLNNVAAIVYIVVVGFFCFWPMSAQTTAANMNYAVVVLGAVAIASSFYYLVSARNHYNGPKVEVELASIE